MTRKFLPLLLLILFSQQTAFSQTLINIVESPTYTVDCDSTCATLHLDHLVTHATDTYAVESIAYVPASTTGASTVTVSDDHFSTAISIGFTFCFYGQTYNYAYVSDNGHLTFNSLYSGGSASFDTKTALPYYNSTYPDAAIFSPFMDNKPVSGSSIKYLTTGTAPFRKFIVEWNNMSLFGSTCGTGTSTYQVVLYETTNIVDCFITSKVTCDADPDNYRNFAVMGIQSLGAVNYETVPGRNSTIWTASNDGWRFDPAGAVNSSVSWYPSWTITASTADFYHACPPGYPATVMAKMTFACPAATYWDTVTLIKIFPHIDSIAIDSPLCLNTMDGSVTIYASGATTPYTYSAAPVGMSSFGSSSTIAVGAGPIVVSVKDANGCRKDTNIFIYPKSHLVVHVDSMFIPTCPIDDGLITVSGDSGLAPYTYLWSTGDTTATIDSLAGGTTYTVTVTDALGCEKVKIIPLGLLGIPQLTATSNAAVCTTPTGSATVNVTGGTAPYTYLWSPAVSTTASATGMVPGYYNVHVTDSNGCTNVILILVHDTLQVLALRDTIPTICGLPNGQASVAPYNGLAPYTYLWSDGQTNDTAIGLTGGMTYSVVTTAANGCTRTDYYYVAPSPVFTLNTFPANAYCDSANGVINTTYENNTGPVTYTWSSGDTGMVATDLAAGDYTVTIVDGIGCTMTDTVTILNDGTPQLIIVAYNQPACYGDSDGVVILSGANGVAPYKYSFDGINFSTTAVIDSIAAGTYTIYIRDANSCPGDTSVTFTQPSAIDISVSPIDTLVCYIDQADSVYIAASGGHPPYVYRFDGSAFTTDQWYFNLPIGPHVVEARDSSGCEQSFTIVVPGPDSQLMVGFYVTDVPCFQLNTGAIHVNSTGGWQPYHYTWSNGLDIDHSDSLIAGHYTITITDDRGCSLTGQADVDQMLCCVCKVADAFTPNNDGRNDILHVLKISDVSELDFRIYNRLGQEVYHSTSLDAGWDGYIGGKLAAMDVYFYYLEYRCPFSSEKYTLKGDVTLIR